MAELLDEKKYLTQSEFADYFRISEGTAKNWREKRYVCYFQVPGSTRVLYPVDAIRDFERQYTKRAKGGDRGKRTEIKRKRPGISATKNKEWRV